MVNIKHSDDWLTYIRSHCENSGIELITNDQKVGVDMKGKKIYCPMPDEFNEEGVKKVIGFIKHGIAKILYSKDFHKSGMSTADQKNFSLNMVCNAVEDARVEAQLGKKYMGISQDFRELNEMMVDLISKALPKLENSTSGASILMRNLFAFGKLTYPADKIDPELLKTIETNKNDLLTRFYDAKTTNDAIELGKHINTLFPNTTQEDFMNMLKKLKAKASGKGEAEGKAGSKEESEEEGEADEDAITQMIKHKIMKEVGGYGKYTGNEYVYNAKTKVLMGKQIIEMVGQGTETLKSDPSVVNSTRRVLMDYLVAKSRCRTLFNVRKGKIATRSLFRVKTCKERTPNLFKKVIDGEEITADVLVLVDYSGSMRGSKFRCANQLMLNLHEALKGVKGIDYSVAGFSTNFGENYGKLNGVVEDTAIYCLKEFGSRVFDHEGLKSVMRQTMTHNNNDYEAIKWARREFDKGTGQRKILFVLADGHPAVQGVSCNKLTEITIREVEHCRKVGIEVYGFGIEEKLNDIYGNKHSIHFQGSRDINTGVSKKLLNLLVSADRK